MGKTRTESKYFPSYLGKYNCINTRNLDFVLNIHLKIMTHLSFNSLHDSLQNNLMNRAGFDDEGYP